MPDLFPVFDVPTIIEQQEGLQDTPSYSKSVFFDFEIGDFKKDQNNRIVIATPKETWVQWCVKAVMSERFQLLAYSDDYGAELESSFEIEDDEAIKSNLIRTISETLLADPMKRTASVADFTFEFSNGDGLIIGFEVVGVDGLSEAIKITL